MIWSFLIDLLAFVLTAITLPLQLLPDVTLPVEITNSITILAPYYSAINAVLPVDSILFVLTIIEIPFLLGLGTYFIVRWIYQKLPFLN